MTYFNKIAAVKIPFIERKGLAKLRQAVEHHLQKILLLEGDAGIGKTTLLEWAAQLAAACNVVSVPIIDFYDTNVHSFQGLELVIADALDSRPEGAFAAYRTARQKDPQADLWAEFEEAYSVAVTTKHVLLCFDTVERLVYERDPDPVLRDCGIEEIDAPSWQWLLGRAGQLPNTTVLLAARPTQKLLLTRLEKAYGDRVDHVAIAGFNLQETTDYFRAFEFGNQIVDASPEMIEKIHLLSDGRPILIALALDWLQRGVWDLRLYPMGVNELRQMKATSQNAGRRTHLSQEWDIIKHHFEIALVKQIRDLKTPVDKAVTYLALCRKGCNAELLARLMNIPSEDATSLVAELRALSFVKLTRSGDSMILFLHDEMYDLVEQYVWSADYPDYEEQARLDEQIVIWYKEQIDRRGQEISEAPNRLQRRKLRRDLQLIVTERLYYQLDLDPKSGYREYSHLAEQAIGARELEWDSWLRNELFAFIAQRANRWKQVEAQRTSKVEHDARRLWISRFIARADYDRAIRTAEKLLTYDRQSDEPPLYRGGLRITLATAQAYKGGPLLEEAVRNFDEGIRIVEVHLGEERDRWLPQYLLGTAHLYKGLALRGARPLAEAQMAYGTASSYFRRISYRPGLAEALNNLAYVRARQGKLRQALAACNEALSIREELGDEYSIGLSLNTKGIIEERLDRSVTAIHNSDEALRIFTEIGNERGMIMAAINLGRAYRRKGRSRDWRREDADFEAGETHLAAAMQRQETQGDNAEVYYRIQAHNELGCLYRDWAATLYEKRPHDPGIESFLQKARANLNEAIRLATGREKNNPLDAPQYVDSLEDLARVYLLWARVDTTSKAKWLQEMDPLLTEAESLVRSRIEQLDELQLVLGKIYFQRARQAQERRDGATSAKCFALATGNVETYSIDAPELEKIVSEASSWLARLEPSEVKNHIKLMREALTNNRLPGTRLWEWIDNVVQPLLGVGWDEETVNG